MARRFFGLPVGVFKYNAPLYIIGFSPIQTHQSIRRMIKSFIKQLFQSKSPAPTANAASRDAKKKQRARVKKPVLHKAASYPVKQHGINPKHIPESARMVTQVLSDAGFEAYVVGGAVRDLMLGYIPKDFDVATNARPEQVLKLFRRARIIGRRFRIVHVMHKRDLIEVTTFRSDNQDDVETDEHGRVLRDNVYGTIESDAVRRDMTINALYYDVKRQVVLDYHGGVPDLREHVLRIIGEPSTRFREDPVRMLRVLRFMAKLNFDVDAHTLDAMDSHKELLSNIPSARLFDETLKFFTTGHAEASLEVLQDYGFTSYLLPVLAEGLATDEGQTWVRAVLRQTDDRVAEDKSLSPGFLFAALMWMTVQARWQFYQAQHAPVLALDAAMNEVLHQDNQDDAAVHLTKRFIADMRDIWSLQPRLQRRMPRQAFKLLEHPRFRAGYDFFLLRAELGHLGEDGVEVANWWGEMYAADQQTRERMVEELRQQPNADTGAKRKRRRRSRSKSKSNGDSADSADNSTTDSGE